MLLKWGWVLQRVPLKFRPNIWKKRYVVLTTMSVHVYKSERGVISDLFQEEETAEVHLWSNFQSVDSLKKGKKPSKFIFTLETRDPQAQVSLQFKCDTTEEKAKWIAAINEQLSLTTKTWFTQPGIEVTGVGLFGSLIKRKKQEIPNMCNLQNPIVPVSVLDRWLEQLEFMDTPEKQEALTQSYKRGSNSFEASHIRNIAHKRSSVQEAGAVIYNERRNSL
ncbi:hypothetical protein MBANPS3_011345 [Mucor bainieri]